MLPVNGSCAVSATSFPGYGGIFFVGTSSLLKSLPAPAEKHYIVFDSNVLLTLLSSVKAGAGEPTPYLKMTSTCRAHLHKYWTSRVEKASRHIPINAAFAAFELTKQDISRDEAKYLQILEDLDSKVFPATPMGAGWHSACYKDVRQFADAVLPTLQDIVSKILSLVPPGVTSEKAIAGAVDALISWLYAQQGAHKLSCGTLLHEGILAFAGNEKARELLKIKDIQKKGAQAVARNVAWDMLFMHYHALNTAKPTLGRPVFCTRDVALASLMEHPYRENFQPALPRDAENAPIDVPAYVRPLTARRLKVGTKLREQIIAKVNEYTDDALQYIVSAQANAL